MPVIPEEGSVSEAMDEFVNWDASTDAAVRCAGDTMAPEVEPIFPDQGLDVEHLLVSPRVQQMNDREALLFENPDADDFSFWALEHYEQSNMPTKTAIESAGIATTATAGIMTGTDAAVEALLNSGGVALPLEQGNEFCPPELWGVPDEPCAHCKQGGYQCKTIQEGSYKGYCTSCVALRCECSFGLASGGPVPTAVSFPPNPWPTLGDHPDPIRHDEESMDAVGQLSLDPIVSSNTATPNLTGRASPKQFAGSQSKLGARFSRESVRILKNWVSTHSRHPYPTEEEKESLQRLTGLNKTQISNWLANARRRGKIPTTRSTSPHVRNSYSGPGAPVGAIDIPQPRRSGTPSPFDRRAQQLENIPLQRWANSPPENEPASVTDIARAITSSASAISSGLNSPLSLNFTDDGSGRSLFNGSSASSVGTSQSSGAGSFASAFSHASRGSFGSTFSSLGRGRRRRRRRSAPHQGVGSGYGDEKEERKGDKKSTSHSTKLIDDVRGKAGPTPLVAPLKTYQCTFCTETFKTKHDWQRHEKSLHLSLERWVCTPHGAVATHPDSKQLCCVFCDKVNPDAAHVESHNFAACQERALSDRTFYRKDHLRQHLKLVHGVKFVHWSMDQWKVASPEIRSRCGFCGIVMDNWTFRVDHLADHFKTGRTMADWKGDWGFEQPVLEMVENSIPPYLIHDERNSPLPFSATSQSPGSPRNAYELFRGELAYWLQIQDEKNNAVDDQEMRFEACRIVFAADMIASTNQNSPSWLRDLLMADENCTQRARLSPIRSQAESRMATMRINGKEAVFDMCPLESALHDFVQDRSQLGLTPTDTELQTAACDLIRKMEIQLIEGPGESVRTRISTEKRVAEFWLRLIKESTAWLTAFRKRAHLPRSDAIADETRRPVHDPSNIDATIHNYSRLEAELADFVRARCEAGDSTPDDATLQRQARLIIYELDDGWNQTAADDTEWLAAFKSRHISREEPRGSSHLSSSTNNSNGSSNSRSPNYIIPSPFFLNDTNCYRRLARELTRFATMVMSTNNPNCHVPTDEELQHQARWILYDDDDPWNQTAADNAEWLKRFKRDVGILPSEGGPGLPVNNPGWSVSQGGTGFAPPYCFPKTPMAPFTSTGDEHGEACNGESGIYPVTQVEGTQPMHGVQYGLAPSTANKYLQSFTTRYAKPAIVFCSRELENGLTDYVRTIFVESGQPFPDNEALRSKACEILGCSPEKGTPADDNELLGKFKDMVRTKLAEEQAEHVMSQLPSETLGMSLAGDIPLDMSNMNVDLNLDSVTQEDMDNLFQDMNFDFEDGVDLISGQ